MSDFGIVIVLGSAVLIDYFVGFNTPKLEVPLKFEVKKSRHDCQSAIIKKLFLLFEKTTLPTRGWFIDPIARNPDKLWLGILAIIPGFLASILLFMDQHIPAVIINRKENHLKVI